MSRKETVKTSLVADPSTTPPEVPLIPVPPEEAALARLQTVRQRFFMDSDMWGNEYLIPAEKRLEWDGWDIACEHAGELLPAPEWAKKLQDQIRWVEFETPVEVSI